MKIDLTHSAINMKYLFLTSILLTKLLVYGQVSKVSNEKAAAIQITKQIGSNLNQDLLFALPDNDAFLVSVGVLIDQNGNVEYSFYSPNSVKAYNAILNYNTLLGKMKSIHFKSYGYTDCILVLPILFKHADALKVENGKKFFQSLMSIWPEIPAKYKDKKIHLLPPEINSFFKPIR